MYILALDDDREWLTYVGKLLKQAGYDYQLVSSASAMEVLVADRHPDLVITDLMMPGISGIQVYNRLREKLGPDTPIIVCSTTKLRFKNTDPRLAYCAKFDAPAELTPLASTMLESSKPKQSNSEVVNDPLQRNPA